MYQLSVPVNKTPASYLELFDMALWKEKWKEKPWQFRLCLAAGKDICYNAVRSVPGAGTG